MNGPSFFGLCSRGARISSTRPERNRDAVGGTFEFDGSESRRAIHQGIQFAALHGIEDSMDGDFIAKSIEVLAGVARRVSKRILTRMRREPAARKDIRKRGTAERERGVVSGLDSVLSGAAEMLIATDMESGTATECLQRAVATGLRPSVRV